MIQKIIQEPTHVFAFPDDGDLTPIFIHRRAHPGAPTVLLVHPDQEVPVDFCIEHDLDFRSWAGSIFSYILAQPDDIRFTVSDWGKKKSEPLPTVSTGTNTEILASIPNSLIPNSVAVASLKSKQSMITAPLSPQTAAVELQLTALAQDTTQTSIIATCATDVTESAAPSKKEKVYARRIQTSCNACSEAWYLRQAVDEAFVRTKTVFNKEDYIFPTPTTPYTIILIDPPWFYNSRHAGAETKAIRAAKNPDSKAHGTKFGGGCEKHYVCPEFRRSRRLLAGWNDKWDPASTTPPPSQNTTLSNVELLEVAAYINAITAPDAVMFCWVTGPVTWESHFAFDFMTACGFLPKTNAFNWFKITESEPPAYIYGPGFYSASNMETCVVAIKGNGLGQPLAKMVPSIIQFDDLNTLIPMTLGSKSSPSVPCIALCPRGAHSEKPLIHSIIESWHPDQPSLEIFSRDPQPDWDSVGGDLSGRDILEDLADVAKTINVTPPLTEQPARLKPKSPKKKKESLAAKKDRVGNCLIWEQEVALKDALTVALTANYTLDHPTTPTPTPTPLLCLCPKCDCTDRSLPYGPNHPSPQICLNCGEET